MAQRPRRQQEQQKKKQKRRSPVGCLAWFALILLVVVVFLATRSSIAKAVESSGLSELLRSERKAPSTQGQAEAAKEPPTAAQEAPGPELDSAGSRANPNEPSGTAEPLVATPRPQPA